MDYRELGFVDGAVRGTAWAVVFIWTDLGGRLEAWDGGQKLRPAASFGETL